MADAALFIGWGNPVRGREQTSLGVFNESMAYWGQLQAQGEIESVQAFMLEPHGGDLGGFALLLGSRTKLDEIRASDDFQRLVARAGLIVDNLGIVMAATGEALGAQMGMFQAQVAELAS
jgi:hypothetical protein